MRGGGELLIGPQPSEQQHASFQPAIFQLLQEVTTWPLISLTSNYPNVSFCIFTAHEKEKKLFFQSFYSGQSDRFSASARQTCHRRWSRRRLVLRFQRSVQKLFLTFLSPIQNQFHCPLPHFSAFELSSFTQYHEEYDQFQYFPQITLQARSRRLKKSCLS